MQDFILVNGFEIKRVDDTTYLVNNILTLNVDEKRTIIDKKAINKVAEKLYVEHKEEFQRYIQQYDFFIELQK